MELLLVGLSHKTAPIEIRERVFLQPERLQDALRTLSAHPGIEELAILSTCNRTEIYAVSESNFAADEPIISYLEKVGGETSEFRRYLYSLESSRMARHLLRVATGIESMVVGEGQILGQVREAAEVSRTGGTSGPILNSLFNQAVAAGKRARAETEIARGAVSVSHVAVELAKKVFEGLAGRSILLIGAGKMSEVALRFLLKQGVSRIEVANRTYERASVLAASLQAESIRWDELPRALTRADLVLTSTAADSYILDPPLMRRAIWERRGRPLLVIDIAVPRDVDPEVGKIDNIYLYNIDDLQRVVDQNLSQREREIPRVLEIIEEEEAAFFKWLIGRQERLQLGQFERVAR